MDFVCGKVGLAQPRHFVNGGYEIVRYGRA
jgi:hypothetical protein